MSHASISDRDWADRRPVELSRRDRALKSVEEYEAAYSQSLDEETKAKYLHLIANIYSGQLQDYDSAANYYARIVIRYPESSSAVHAYSDLAYAYENAGRSQLANGVYYQMMQEFPEDSEVHDEAAIALGFRPVPDDDDIDEDPIE